MTWRYVVWDNGMLWVDGVQKRIPDYEIIRAIRQALGTDCSIARGYIEYQDCSATDSGDPVFHPEVSVAIFGSDG